jgi:hypothetical protein
VRASTHTRVASLAAVTILLVAAVALTGCGREGAADGSARGGEANPQSRLAADFRLFRRPARARDEVPGDLVSQELAARLGLDVADAKLARARVFSSLYVVPGKRAVCMFDTEGISAPCWPPRTVARGMAVSTSICSFRLPAGELRMVGLVPDGVSEVWVQREDGERARFTVRHNVFLARLKAGPEIPARVGWTRDGRRHDQTAGISPRVVRTACADGQSGR